jgi:uncharacterized paraquat-inducible protein A
MHDELDNTVARSRVPKYTGVVCCRCLTPVAQMLDHDTAHCPRCGHEWEVPPPVTLKAA